MPKTPGKMHMYDIVKIDTTVFKILGGGGAFKAPPPAGSLTVWSSPDRIGLSMCREDETSIVIWAKTNIFEVNRTLYTQNIIAISTAKCNC